MKTKILALSLAATAVFAFKPAEIMKHFDVNVKSSKLEWTGEKVTGSHTGTVDIKSGKLNVADGKIKGGSFTIDMTSIKNTDLEGEYATKLEGHLKSEDFFSVEKHPEAKFVIKSVAGDGDQQKVTGDLTIKGITNEITIPATVETKGNKISAHAEFSIDRSKWEVKYGSGSFFDDLGDKVIYDDIKFKLNLIAESAH